jgi:succinate--hydroxymethylglutarate CoA-transferase
MRRVKGPLDGIRVLDLSRVLAGPFATQILGDFGAEVLKIEQPGVGDITRKWGPPFIESESTYFMSVNRNKSSIAIDIKHEEGKKIIRKLSRKCDVLVENFIPGQMDEFGLGYEDLKRENPSLIYCSLSGFGSTGPLAKKPGFDVLVSAMFGLMGVTGPSDGPACKPGVAVTDIMTGMMLNQVIFLFLNRMVMLVHILHLKIDTCQNRAFQSQ